MTYSQAASGVELYLFRHGETDTNVFNEHLIIGRGNEIPLNPNGRKQARLLGRHLLREQIIPDRIFASPAVRTRDTAVIAVEEMGGGPELVLCDALQEMDQGEWVGRVREEIYTDERRAELDQMGKDFKAPGGESMNEVGGRMLGWANDIVRSNTNGTPERVFAFSHGVAIRCLASHVRGWSSEETFTLPMHNTAINLLAYRDGFWSVGYLDQTPHLVAQHARS